MENAKIFQKIPEASRTTGLSQFWLRKQARAGKIPVVMSGPVYMINVPALLRQLDAESEARHGE